APPPAAGGAPGARLSSRAEERGHARMGRTHPLPLTPALPMGARPSARPSAGIRLCRGPDHAAGSGEHRPDVAGPVVELVVQVDRGVDQGKGAGRLREGAELRPGPADLPREPAPRV